MNKFLGYGRDQKVIYLNENDTYKYLCIQVLDIIHDSDTKLANSNSVNNIIHLMSTWLYQNNTIFKNNITFKQLSQLLESNINNLMPSNYTINLFIENEFNSALNKQCNDLFLLNKYDVSLISADTLALLDSCESNNSIFCTDKAKYSILTQSVLYDNGAHNMLCGRRTTRNMNNIIPQFSKANNSYWNQKEVINSIQSSVFSECVVFKSNTNDTVTKTLNNIYDYYLIGTIMNYTVVLTYRGIDIVNNYVYFNQKVAKKQDNISRGYSPSTKMLKPLYDNISNVANTNSIIDKLLLYNELVAKHWGDLGFIFDIANTNIYLITQDNILQYLCVFFGVNYSSDNKLYTSTKRQRTEILYNTTTWFS